MISLLRCALESSVNKILRTPMGCLIMTAPYITYCQRQASDCARRARLASSPEIKAYHRHLGLRWIKLAEKARVSGSRTGSVTCTLRGVAGTESLPNSAYLSKI